MEPKICKFCNAKLYILQNGMVKCSMCKKKYSLKKIQRRYDLIDAFLAFKSAHHTSKALSISYQTVFDYFKYLRTYTVEYTQARYEYFNTNVEEFEEYTFTYAKHQSTQPKHITFTFVTLSKGGHIYNMVLPTSRHINRHTLQSQMKRIKRNAYIGKLNSYENSIADFWKFFETCIKQYKGVNAENFILYVKQAEFKFNHTLEKQKQILYALV